MNARMSFSRDQIDTLPAVLYALHAALEAVVVNADSKGHWVDWAADWSIAGRVVDGRVVVTCDPTYAKDADTSRQFAIAATGEQPDEAESGSEAFDTLYAARENCGPNECVLTRRVTSWVEVQTDA